MMKTIHSKGQAEYRANTPTGLQDCIVNVRQGIMRTTDIKIGHQDTIIDYNNGSDEYTREKTIYNT